MTKLVTALCFLLPSLVFAAPGKGVPTAGYHKIWEASLPCTGERITGPDLHWVGPDTYRVQVTGVLDTRKLGAKYDAELRSISAKEFRVKHDHLRFASPSWVGLYGHHEDHRYVYGLKPRVKKRPEQLILSLEGIAIYYRISPSRLKRESKSTLRVSLWKKGDTPRGGSPVRWDFAALFAGLGLLGWLLYWVTQRRSSRRAD